MTTKKSKAYSYSSTLHARVYDGISKCRENYANNKNAQAGIVNKVEEWINTLRHEVETLDKFVSTHWLNRTPSGHYYVQLA